MEAYEVMQILNGILLMMALGMAGALWKKVQDDRKETRQDIGKLFATIETQQREIHEVATSTKLLAQRIEMNQQQDNRRLDLLEKLVNKGK